MKFRFNALSTDVSEKRFIYESHNTGSIYLLLVYLENDQETTNVIETRLIFYRVVSIITPK